MLSVAAFYCFAPFEDPDALRGPLVDLCTREGLRGSILLATEGVNGTVAGPRAGLDVLIAHICALRGCAGMVPKWSEAEDWPFGKMKVRLKREIVTMGQPDVDPRLGVGRYVPAAVWNDVVRDPNTVLIDTRNDYEVEIGTFEGAIDPKTESFGDFPGWWAAHRDQFEGKRVAMFCTGGIRCEKSTAYLRAQGVEDVVHLQGGILKYLEDVPEAESLWRGACFVFDDRVGVEHGLVPSEHTLCHGCRRPLTPDARAHPFFEDGVQCHRCAGERSDADRERSRERVRQIRLARTRGDRHFRP